MDAATPESKSLAWTDEAKYQLLLRIVAQLRSDGRSINWLKIDMPGRTVKSLQNMWTKINKSIAEFEQDTEDRPPIKRPTPRKRGPNKPKATTSHDDEDDRGSVSPVATPKKRRASKAPSVDEKKIKISSDEDDKGGIRCVEGEI